MWAVVAATCVAIAAVWLDLALELSPMVRLVALVGASIIGCGSFAALLLRSISQTAPLQLARRLDSVGGTGGQILSGVDLSNELVIARTAPAPELCVELARYAVRQAATLAELVPSAKVIPIKPLGMSAAATIAIGLAISAAVILMPDLARTQWLRFSDPFGDHPPYAASTFVLEPAGARVRYGEGLDIFVTVEGKPVDSLELILQPRSAKPSENQGEIVPMFQEPGGRWRAALTNVIEEQNYFVRARRARSGKYGIDVITVPQIKDVRFRITQPAYARRSVYEGPMPANGIAGLTGAKVEIFVTSNRPLTAAHGKLTSKEGSENLHWAAAKTDVQIAGSFVIERSGRLDLTVIDEDQQASKDGFSVPIVLLPDDRPFVRLLEPKPVSFATPTSLLPVVISAEDDYGIGRLQLFRSLNDSRYLPMEIPPGSPAPTSTQQGIRLPLADYDLTAGDEIKLFARVEDNDPAGSKGAESAIAIVRIISEEEFASMIQTRESVSQLVNKYNQVQRRMEGLAQEMEEVQRKLEKLPPDSPLAEEARNELERLAERIEEESDAIAKLGETELPYELDKELKQHVAKTSKELESLAQELKELSAKQGLSHASLSQELKSLQAKLGSQREELQQQTGPPLDSLAAAYPLMEDENRFLEIYERQKDLAERLGAFRGRDQENDPSAKARMRELEAEQRQVREDLWRLLDDIEEHAAKLPNTEEMQPLREQAEAFASAVRESGVDGVMKEGEASLAEFAGTSAVESAEKARDILESFIKKCNGMGDQASSCMCMGFQPTMSNCLSETASQLLAQAGFGKGRGKENGRGEGGGGGYSARRSTLQNVGLYGNTPRESSPSQGMRSGLSNQTQSGRAQNRGSTGGDNAAGFELGNTFSGASASEAAVPPQYRRKVGRYFQRIADEIGAPEK
jgi:hypothetical protein